MLRCLKTILFLLLPVVLFAQEATEDEITPLNKKGFQLGIQVGSYFANKYTADAYDGWGFDLNSNRHRFFTDSWMYNKIIMQYGGGYGGVDQIAQAMNVNHTDWSFTENDMPINMRYTPSFLFGINCRYSMDGKNAILFNLNMAKVNANGNFTIQTLPPTGSSQINKSIRTYGIKGQEQRLMIQIGYNRTFGKGERVNPVIEGGLNMTYAQFDKNEILIENLYINLIEFYDYQGVQNGYTRLPRGWGFGAFAGLGLNFAMNEKFLIQILYNPSYEGINIGDNPRLKMQHAINLRAYYNFL